MALLTKQQAAERLGVHAKTVQRLISVGELTARRFGYRTVRIDETDLQRFLDEHKTKQ